MKKSATQLKQKLRSDLINISHPTPTTSYNESKKSIRPRKSNKSQNFEELPSVEDRNIHSSIRLELPQLKSKLFLIYINE